MSGLAALMPWGGAWRRRGRAGSSLELCARRARRAIQACAQVAGNGHQPPWHPSWEVSVEPTGVPMDQPTGARPHLHTAAPASIPGDPRKAPRGATCVLSTCPEACPRGRLSGCCSCGRPARLRVVARRDTPVPALSRGPVCVPRPSRVTWWFCLAPVPFVSASARWFTCACSRFLCHRCVRLSWPNLSRGSRVRAASVSCGFRTATHLLSRFAGLRARCACARI